MQAPPPTQRPSPQDPTPSAAGPGGREADSLPQSHVLKADNLHRSYRMGRHRVAVLKGASLEVRTGEFLGVMGASGSGKSTLLHLLGGLDRPDVGDVLLDGESLFRMNRRGRECVRNLKIGFIFQFYHLLPELSVLENLMVPSLIRYSWAGWMAQRTDIRTKCESTLESVGLKERMRHRPNELSGGEMQRVAIARAIVHRPRLLLADEPTGNLDRKTGMGVLDLLMSLNAQGQTLVMVTHDPDVAAHAHRGIQLSDGRIGSLEKQSTGA